MDSAPIIDMEKLKADMAACVERTSARQFSLKATGGKNEDFYRNLVNNGQDKRISADVFFGIVKALEREPSDYVIGMSAKLALPNATVLTSAFAVLLDSLGIDPHEDGRARKLAAQFPGALRSAEDFHLQAVQAIDSSLAEDALADAEERPPA